jgi:hypothetical protein
MSLTISLSVTNEKLQIPRKQINKQREEFGKLMARITYQEKGLEIIENYPSVPSRARQQ